MTNGVIIDAESGLPLIAMVGYQPNERTKTHRHIHTLSHVFLCAHWHAPPPPLSLPPSLTHHFHLLRALTGALMRINLPTSANKVTHPDIPRSASPDLFAFYRHARTPPSDRT